MWQKGWRVALDVQRNRNHLIISFLNFFKPFKKCAAAKRNLHSNLIWHKGCLNLNLTEVWKSFWVSINLANFSFHDNSKFVTIIMYIMHSCKSFKYCHENFTKEFLFYVCFIGWRRSGNCYRAQNIFWDITMYMSVQSTFESSHSHLIWY